MLYKYDLHVHTNAASACGVTSPEETVDAFIRAGYSGFALTEHFIFGNTSVPRNLPWEQRMMKYYDAYRRCADAASGRDFNVFFAVEHYYGEGMEVLIYGVNAEFWLKNPDIPQIDVTELARRVHAAGGYISHAHPFRERSYISGKIKPDPSWLDGAEIYNASNGNEAFNDRALEFMKANGLGFTSGSDIHDVRKEELVGSAGLAFRHPIRTDAELVAALKSRSGLVIAHGEVQSPDYVK